MKKAIAAILVVLYFTTTTGTTINFYYCQGKKVAENMAKTEIPSCSKCKMEKKVEAKSACCQHEQKFVKLINDQNISDASFHIQQPVSIISPIVFFENNNFHFPSLIAEYPVSNAPPRSSGITIYKRNCTFLI
ncbi:MAG TPA: hypothetical protein VIJ95_04515 [Hanamia sp.]